MTVVAVDPGDAACRRCLIAERLIPFALHPIRARGGRMTYPRIVPDELIVHLAALGERPGLIPLVARLLDHPAPEGAEHP